MEPASQNKEPLEESPNNTVPSIAPDTADGEKGGLDLQPFDLAMSALESALSGARRSYYNVRNQIADMETHGKSLEQTNKQAAHLIADMESRHAAIVLANQETIRKQEAQIAVLTADNTEIRHQLEAVQTSTVRQLHARDMEAHRLQTAAKQFEAQAGTATSELAATRKVLEELQKDRERRMHESALKQQQLAQELMIEGMKLQSANARLTEVLERNRELEAEKIRADATLARASDNEGQSDRLRRVMMEQRDEIQRLRGLNESLAATIREKSRSRAIELDPELSPDLPPLFPDC